ncbi:Hypothetical protein PHPALM_2039 [Phytophthora palmivora]|uniref:FYVE-type domain-containing protein n=1 Tax=Phytophthora palmivora TaxID=4796 RepID=A0A2P4YQS9_9STRA|nr:Hypothetical protein PHPALM_2039 [Phytophthora palmivora]
MIKTLVVPSMATGYLTILKYAHCSEMKKITWLLRKRHATFKESGRPNRPPVCVTCTAPISKVKGHTCKLCSGYLCRSCRVQRKVAIVGLAGFLDQHKVTFCGRCLQQVREMSPLEIAKEYAAGVAKQTISYASIDSSVSSSMYIWPVKGRFDASWTKQDQILKQKNKNQKRPNVNVALWEATKDKIAVAMALYLVSATLTLLQPFLIKAILEKLNPVTSSPT